MTVRFTVPGIPAPQGSKTPWGTEANPNTRPWRATVAAAAADAMGDLPPLAGPVHVRLLFRFPRPLAHYRTGKRAGELKPGAPWLHDKKPDADKLARACLDAMSGICFVDDARVSRLAVAKLYGPPGATVTVKRLGGAS